MRGRKPTPTRLKILTGNPGKHPLNPDEPRPEPAIPDCPPELSPAAQREWARLVTTLGPLRVLTHLDRAALAAYCAAYALWAEATEAIQKYGGQITHRLPHPVALRLRRKPAAEIMMRISAEFGFTRANRGRTSVAAEPEKTLFDGLERDET